MPCNCGSQQVELLFYVPGLTIVRCPSCGLVETMTAGGLSVGKAATSPLLITTTQTPLIIPRIPAVEIQREQEIADLRIALNDLKKLLKEKQVI